MSPRLFFYIAVQSVDKSVNSGEECPYLLHTGIATGTRFLILAETSLGVCSKPLRNLREVGSLIKENT